MAAESLVIVYIIKSLIRGIFTLGTTEITHQS